jgi:hypothetical protein
MIRNSTRGRRNSKRFRPGIGDLEARLLLSSNVLTYHNDNSRSGLNSSETILTPSNVNASTFGKLGFDSVDGKVDAQPLYVANVTVPGQGTHNILYVATEHDSVYAFDADTGAQLWKVSMLGTGEVPSDPVHGSQVTPEIGVTATPVIDPTSNTMYVVAMSKHVSGSTTTYIQRLHALDITTGADKIAPKSIDQSIIYPGAGPGGNGTDVIFNPMQYKERDALLLSNGVVYTSWASHSDVAPYTGWMIGFKATDLSLASVINVDPNGSPTSSFLSDGSGSSFWNSGGGPAADAAGNIYNLSANGPFDPNLNAAGFPTNGDFGDSFLKFTPTSGGVKVSDYFTVDNQQNEANNDEDIGSSGLVLVNATDTSGQTHQLMVGSGKDGNIYVVDTANMGKFSPTSNNIYQELAGAVGGGEFGSPAAFNGQVYFGGVGATLRAFQFVNGKLQLASQSANTFGYPGTTPSISSNGNTNGIVWAIQNSSNAAVLYAYNAANLSQKLYDSTQAANGRDTAGTDNKFITPTIANGKVYVPTTNGVAVYGLLPTNTTTSVNLSSSFNRIGIVNDGSTFTGGGLDNDGSALSANLLGTSVTAGGATFNIGPAGANDVVSAAGQTITLPSGNFGALKLLATGVNGNQAGKTFTVTYTDGTSTTFTQSISDWFTPQGYAGESTAVATAYRDLASGAKDARTFDIYDYTFNLNAAKTVKSITLPNDANIEVLAATLTRSATTQVGLTGSFNRMGIVNDGSTFTNGGLDHDGSALSANLLGSSVTAGGATFNLGSAGSNDVVSAAGQTITMPSGNYSALKFLATGVNGNQANNSFVVTYTDGTTTTFTQSISDWFTPQGYAGESTAVAMAYRDTASGAKDAHTFNLYSYTFNLNPAKTVKSISLPNNVNVEILALDLLA